MRDNAHGLRAGGVIAVPGGLRAERRPIVAMSETGLGVEDAEWPVQLFTRAVRVLVGREDAAQPSSRTTASEARSGA